MNKAVLLGIDVGSTSIRCCAYDIKTNLIRQASRPTALINIENENQDDATRSWNPELLLKLVYEVVLEVSSFLTKHNYSPLGIASSSVGCSPVLLNKLGNILYPIVRHHGGVSQLLQEYLIQFGEHKFQKKTGYPLAETTTGFLLAQLKESTVEIYSQIETILPVSNYIAFKFTGEKTTDRSIAASFGLWDHDKNTWWSEFLSDLGLGPNNFGTVVDGGEYIGKITPKISEVTGLPIDLPMYSGGHDYLCAALAAGCSKPGQIFNIEGTFEIVATFHKSPLIRFPTDQTRAIMDLHVVPQAYSFIVERIGAGQIEWLMNLLYPLRENTKRDWDTVFNEINDIPDSIMQEEFFVPYIYGMLFPKFKDGFHGGILGINNTSTRSSIMRSAILSHCLESRRMIDFQKDWNSGEINQIVTVGGITRSKLWMQQKANIIGLKIIVPKIEEPSALGAALSAGIGSEIYKDLYSVNKIINTKEVEIYKPNRSKSDYYADYFQRVYLPVLKQVGVIEEIKESAKKENCND